MAEYTMELREIVKNCNIFDFEYPIWKEGYRKTFEEKFINHFYFREIGVETVARFKHNLKEQLNLIMPYYNKMYYSQSLEQRILDNYDVTETFQKSSDSIRNEINNLTGSIRNTGSKTYNETNNVTGNTTNTADKTHERDVTNKTLYSDTGRKRIDIDDVDFVSNINKEINKEVNTLRDTSVLQELKDSELSNNSSEELTSQESKDNTLKSNENNTESWTRKMIGNIGVQTDAYAIKQYEESIKNIDLLVFNELDILFMGVY